MFDEIIMIMTDFPPGFSVVLGLGGDGLEATNTMEPKSKVSKLKPMLMIKRMIMQNRLKDVDMHVENID